MTLRVLFLLLGVVISMFVETSARASAEPKVLNVYHWYQMIDPSILAQFEAETGIKVHMDVYDSNEILETRLLVGNSGYDVVGPSALPYLARQVPANVYLPLDKTKLPNAKELDPDIMAHLARADPGNAHALPLVWGLVGIAYNKEKIAAIDPHVDTKSWSMLFDPKELEKFHRCGATMLPEYTDIFLPMYLYLGLSPKSQSLKDLDLSVEQLLKMRPFIERFDSSRPLMELFSGEVCLAMVWLSDLERERSRIKDKKRASQIQAVLPKEGTVLWIDTMAIPADAPHPGNAHAFLNFLLRPDIIAKVTNKAYTANAVPASNPYILPEILTNTGIYPEEKMRPRLFLNEPVSPAFQRRLNRAMTKIRTGR
ncbi:MAG: extracellular solute-binding protein [Proteobacteria bacterium]|nr:extracellular solute-binding protein [Pseudomonadota bacterium]